MLLSNKPSDIIIEYLMFTFLIGSLIGMYLGNGFSKDSIRKTLIENETGGYNVTSGNFEYYKKGDLCLVK